MRVFFVPYLPEVMIYDHERLRGTIRENICVCGSRYILGCQHFPLPKRANIGTFFTPSVRPVSGKVVCLEIERSVMAWRVLKCHSRVISIEQNVGWL